MRISDWSSDVCSSDLRRRQILMAAADCFERRGFHGSSMAEISKVAGMSVGHIYHYFANKDAIIKAMAEARAEEIVVRIEGMRRSGDVLATIIENARDGLERSTRSEEHTSELQSLMRISYAGICLKNIRLE